jgi:hypothetical protein
MSNHIHINFRNPKIVIVLFLAVALLFGLFARGGTTSTSKNLNSAISCKEGEWASSPYFTGDQSDCPDIVEYFFKPAFVNEKASEFNLRFVTLPAGKYGTAMRNSGWVTNSYFVDVDTTDADRLVNKKGSTSQGTTLRAKMSENNSLFYYPFDRYTGEIKAQAVAEISKEPIPSTVIASDSTLSGWKLTFSEQNKPSKATSGKAIYDNGRATLYWKLSRANVVYIAVSILLILMLIALGSAFAITRSIARLKRPPSMNLLLWLATVLFAILQVRTNFPGNPPIGILLDFTVVFPVLGLLLILGIANTFYWLNRTDWDYENENPELMKNA